MKPILAIKVKFDSTFIARPRNIIAKDIRPLDFDLVSFFIQV